MPDRLRVLKVMPGVSADGGAEQSLLALVPGLLASGVDLHLVVLTGRQGLVPPLEAAGVVVHDLSSVGGVVRQVAGIRSVVRSVKPDLVHASLYEATLPTQLAMIGSRIPLLITWANVNYGPERSACGDADPFKLGAYRLVETATGRLSSSWYHAVTRGVATENARCLHVDPSRVLVAERGRSSSLIDAAGAQRSAVRSALGVSNSDRVVLAIGRQDAQKAYPQLLAEFDLVVDAHPDARLWIAGRPGSDSPSIGQALAAMRHANRVSLLGHRDDVPALLAGSDVVVCGSWREGAAGSLIEAMAARRPVVTVRLAGLDGVFSSGVDGVVAERADLAAALIGVLDDAELRAALAEAGRQTYEARFTVEAATAQLLGLYCSVVAGGGAERSISADAD